MDDPDDFEGALRRVLNAYMPSSTSARVEINGGGIGVWLSTLFCALCFGILIGVLALGTAISNRQSDQAREIGELRAYLTAIYMQAPHLRPEEDQ